MFSVANEFHNENGDMVQYHFLVEGDKVTFTRHLNNQLQDKTVYTPHEAEMVMNLWAIVTENPQPTEQ